MVLGGNWRKPPRHHATMLLEVLKLEPKPLASLHLAPCPEGGSVRGQFDASESAFPWIVRYFSSA